MRVLVVKKGMQLNSEIKCESAKQLFMIIYILQDPRVDWPHPDPYSISLKHQIWPIHMLYQTVDCFYCNRHALPNSVPQIFHDNKEHTPLPLTEHLHFHSIVHKYLIVNRIAIQNRCYCGRHHIARHICRNLIWHSVANQKLRNKNTVYFNYYIQSGGTISKIPKN